MERFGPVRSALLTGCGSWATARGTNPALIQHYCRLIGVVAPALRYNTNSADAQDADQLVAATSRISASGAGTTVTPGSDWGVSAAWQHQFVTDRSCGVAVLTPAVVAVRRHLDVIEMVGLAQQLCAPFGFGRGETVGDEVQAERGDENPSVPGQPDAEAAGLE
jgi:hypothetical protein